MNEQSTKFDYHRPPITAGSSRPRSYRHPVDLEPTSTYEVITRQMVESLAGDLREIKSRLNGLLWMITGAIILEIAFRLMGAS